MTSTTTVGIAAALVLIGGPLALGIAGWVHARRAPARASPGFAGSWNWKRAAVSALLYTLAFNLMFLLQELFLVLPKALTPGLRPTLFHNDHRWEGDSPLASLFQGTGVLALLLAGAACALAVQRRRGRSFEARLFIVWMAYAGLFMALPQVVIGAVSPGSDVGMAMAWLGLGETARTAAALTALAAIPLCALRLRRPLLELAQDAAAVADPTERSRFVFNVASLPALIAIPLIVAFRVPREWVEVVVVPLVVSVIGTAWIQAGASWVDAAMPTGRAAAATSVTRPLVAVLLLLLLFQFVLRPGLRFY